MTDATEYTSAENVGLVASSSEPFISSGACHRTVPPTRVMVGNEVHRRIFESTIDGEPQSARQADPGFEMRMFALLYMNV